MTIVQNNSFGAALRKARVAAGLTQRQLAERLGYSGNSGVVSVSNIERGVHFPSLEKLTAMMDCLAIPDEDLGTTLEMRIMSASIKGTGTDLTKEDVNDLLVRLRRT